MVVVPEVVVPAVVVIPEVVGPADAVVTDPGIEVVVEAFVVVVVDPPTVVAMVAVVMTPDVVVVLDAGATLMLQKLKDTSQRSEGHEAAEYVEHGLASLLPAHVPPAPPSFAYHLQFFEGHVDTS